MRALFALVITLLFGFAIQEDNLKREFPNRQIRIVDPEDCSLLKKFHTSLDHRGKRYNGIGENYQQIAKDSLTNCRTVEHHCVRNIPPRISATKSEPFFHVRRTLAFDEDLGNELKTVSRMERCSDRNKGKKKIFPVYCGREIRRDDPEYLDDDTDSAVEEEDENADSSEWDTWTEWSECSASCGCGRQVRWQHCVGKGCAFGLKRAQIRTCHLRDCNTKNLFSWLGVKP